MTDKIKNSTVLETDYLQLLARQYPTAQSAASEIINLQAILNLPKGTEHFMSDLHGENEAFIHILSNASGAIREKVDMLFSDTLSPGERATIATLIYYPEQKLEEILDTIQDINEWYTETLNHLIEVCHLVSSKYTRSKVRKALPVEYSYIIDELLNTDFTLHNKKEYYDNIISTIISIGKAQDFIIDVCNLIKRLIVDRLHIVGDIFDRGPRADIVMDCLVAHHSVDIQWGNHDVLWMGAAAGSDMCIATVLANSVLYNNLEVIETGYGISLRPLAMYANDIYGNTDTQCFKIRIPNDPSIYNKPKDIALGARMYKAIVVIMFKLEGQMIMRNPDFNMSERLLLDKIDYDKGTVDLNGKIYNLIDCDFPTIDIDNPYELNDEEKDLMEQLKFSFLKSEKLQSHIRFLYSKGNLYKCYNGNLLVHGCIPMNEDGSFMEFSIGGKQLCGKQFLDYAEKLAYKGYYGKPESDGKKLGEDFLWFLWCGKNSPLFGREKITTFERRLIRDKSSWTEPKNAYYKLTATKENCEKILNEFGLGGTRSHIINGHIPVKTKDGESPIKGDGKLIVIDGGFCKAYQPTTGIAGYTLIYNSYIMRLSAHKPFSGVENAIRNNSDIFSTSIVFERLDSRIKIRETDTGAALQKNIDELKKLLHAYKSGLIIESAE
ncbi:MAG: fructose-1,6-bisphosphatase [Oscillospiraceae bacterium]|jgi:fructose-1,6-bisphosphatase-3|nr:fructose-1,6-bisphosphatase [Oscillospiraceae bacterium]